MLKVTAMTRVTTLLIVLILTGSPVADAACVSWCDARPITGSACRESIVDPMSVTISDASGTCAALLAANPFLREEARVTFQAQTSFDGFHTPDTLLAGGARLACRTGDCKAIDGRRAALVLRL
jgi:hypothetical protein